MYEKFENIDGQHSWRNVSPEGYVDYPAIYRKGGSVLYFNYDLAKEMGLIPKDHPHKLNPELEDSILKTFSIKILNEYDWENKKSFPKDHLTDRLYMATRYLQLQHSNKRGETSGDGRSIWNGYIMTKNKTFDISSRGTGTTRLSPGAQETDEHIPTGSDKYGYASGLADIDEMLASAVMSEIFYREGIPTERCLTVIDYKDKTSVGVRTAPNLLRPAHFFRYLKTDNWDDLKKSFDYFLDRQITNGVMEIPVEGKNRYQQALEHLAKTYAKLVAILEEEYIFNWLAWDGDNILASGAILDYGSIRQFAAKHNKYRYEDVDRFSTNLTEQRAEARNIIQTMAQAVDFIVTKEKKNTLFFEHDPVLALFDQWFIQEKQKRMLWRVGFTERQINKLMAEHIEKVVAFGNVLNYFEDIKTVNGEKKVPDGVDHPPVFLIRHILRDLPRTILEKDKVSDWPVIDPAEFCQMMAASYADKKDLILTDIRSHRALAFQKLYRQLIQAVDSHVKETLVSVAERSAVINYEFRRTGDGLTWIINEALCVKDKMKQQEFQDTIERFIESQVLIPGEWKPIRKTELSGQSMKSRLLTKMMENLEEFNEKI